MQTDGSLSYTFDGHNLGAGCAAAVGGTYLSVDNNQTILTRLPWALLAGTILQPGQGFTATACCESRDSALSSRFYDVTFTFTSVACS